MHETAPLLRRWEEWRKGEGEGRGQQYAARKDAAQTEEKMRPQASFFVEEKRERPPRVDEEEALRKIQADRLAESVAIAAAAQQKDQEQTVVVSAAVVAAEEGSVAVAAQAGQKDQPDNGAASSVVIAASAVCCY